MSYGMLSWAIAHAPDRFAMVAQIFERHPGCAKTSILGCFRGL
jgi:hypothetical protein